MTATTAPPPRIATLDLIRGIAVMGIFSVNVIGMAMIEAAYFYPPAFGWDGVADRIVWIANFILVDGKMRSLFSILFGASMLLVIERAEQSGRSAVVVHYARMAVLLLFGLVHFYVIWWGDILTLYALVGMVAFFARRFSAGVLLSLAILIFAFFDLPVALALANQPPGSAAAEWAAVYYNPDAAEIALDRAMHASPLAHLQGTVESRLWEPLTSLAFLWPETLALMLLGMWGYRSGFLTGAWSRATYRRIAVGGIGIGTLAFAALGVWVTTSHFVLSTTLAATNGYSAPFRPIMALGYAAAIILLARPGWLHERIAAVGRTAFSNYLGSSLFGLLIFFDTGLGLYADLSRAEAWLFAPLVWLLMLAWSKPWLDRFAYGPLEWLWRSLARLRLQPMRKAAA